MSVTMPPPGSMGRVLRHLRHVQPIVKGPGGKFAKKSPSYAKSDPRFIQPKDRIPYWNISPGDEVRVTVGGIKSVDSVTGEKKVLSYEGTVATVDRERNLVWLRAKDEASDEKLLPRQIKHVGARLRDPEKGEAGGYTPNTAFVVRPIHYSNLQLKVPENTVVPQEYKKELDLKKGVYVSRLTRSKVSYSPRFGHFMWKRYGTVQTSNGSLRLELPWKSIEGRNLVRKPHASTLQAVEGETWIPWDPSDPVKLLSSKKGTSEQAIHRIQKSVRQRAESLKINEMNAKSVEVSPASGKYAGFTKGLHVRMPLIPQAPTASEQLYQERQDIAEWLKENSVEEQQNQGRRTFTAMDYIDSTPVEGPLDTQWHEITSNEQSEIDWTREPSSGKLSQPLSRRDMDTWPVELLMVNDLTNPTGLRNRMRMWNRKQAEKRDLTALKKKQDDDKVKLLREWVSRQEASSSREKQGRSSLAINQMLESASISEETGKRKEETL